MTTTVERTYAVDAPVEEVWELIADPALRAEAISVVESFTVEGEETIWRLRMPIPLVPGTIRVRTRDVERRPPRFVRFVGDSRVMRVEGEHELTATETGCEVRNRFVVDGHLPGVEAFFEYNIDDEIERLIALVDDRLTARTRE